MERRRITVGMKAAVHGLLLAGVGFKKSCEIVNAGHISMWEYVAPDWRRSPLPVRTRAMTEAQFKLYHKLRPIIGREQAFAQAVPVRGMGGAP